MYLERLNALSPKEAREVNDIEAYKYITEPLHIIIAEMTQLKGFKNSLAWIKAHCRPNVNLKDAQEVLDRLVNLEILKKEGSKLIKQIQHIYTSKEVKSRAVLEYHQKMSLFAAEQIIKQGIDEREFNALSFNIKKKDLPRIKESIREFSDQMVQHFEAKAGEGDETYHLNVQFFSLSK